MSAFRLLLALLMVAGIACGPQALELALEDEAEVHNIGQIRIVDPWAKSGVGSGHSAKLFFEFHNAGDKSDRLLKARSTIAKGPTSFSAVVVTEGERRVTDLEAIEIPATDSIFELTEVGYYIEMTNLDVPMVMGKRFPVELTFERAGSATIEFTARFHSPKLTRRIREAASRGDIEALKAMRPIK